MEVHRKFLNDNNNIVAFLHPPELSHQSPPRFHFVSIGSELSEEPEHTLFSDAAWQGGSKRAGMGWYLAKSPSNLYIGKGGCDFGSAASATHAEALACLKCLS